MNIIDKTEAEHGAMPKLVDQNSSEHRSAQVSRNINPEGYWISGSDGEFPGPVHEHWIIAIYETDPP